MAGVSESDPLKPIDNAPHGGVSERPGRSASERTSSLVIDQVPGPSLLQEGEGGLTLTHAG